MNKLKKVLLGWLIVYLLITVLVYSLNGLLIELPIYIQTLILSGLIEFSLQYLILPTIQKLKNKQHHSG